MSNTEWKRYVFGTAILLAAVWLPATAGAEAPQVATMSSLGGVAAWSPHVFDYETLVLSVSGGGFTTSLDFAGGESPQFIPVDSEGYALPDGIYKWELTVIPTAKSLNGAKFRSSETSPDGRTRRAAEMPAGLTQSGAFTIFGGAIADPNLTELANAPETQGPGVDTDDSDAAASN